MKIEEILTSERIDALRKWGILFFDVDDTLLSRRNSEFGAEQNFADSPAAQTLPSLLAAGLRICIVTGHGWKQLESRLVRPLVKIISTEEAAKCNELLGRFSVYANRGATRVEWNGEIFEENRDFRERFGILENDLPVLTEILEQIRDSIHSDPPSIIKREGVILGMRPIHAVGATSSASERERLAKVGNESIRRRGLGDKYEFSPVGTTTLEIARRCVSKRNAFEAQITGAALSLGIGKRIVERNSIFIGDEFSPGGNDLVIVQEYPGCLCLSVAKGGITGTYPNLVDVATIMQQAGPDAAAAIIRNILKFLV